MSNLFKNRYTRIILGIIWGFGLSCILAKSCNDKKCYVYKSPKTEDVVNKIYGHNQKCYKYTIQNSTCSPHVIH
jgi:hypothetical protein